MARQEQPACRELMHRRAGPQRRVMRMRVIDEAGRKVGQVEIHDGGPG